MTMHASYSTLLPLKIRLAHFSNRGLGIRFSALFIFSFLSFLGLTGCYTQFTAPMETPVQRQRIIIPRASSPATDSLSLDARESFEAESIEDAIIIENSYTPNYSRFFTPGFGWGSPYGFNAFNDPFINPWASPSWGFASIWNNPWGVWNPYWGIGGAHWNGLWGFPIAAGPWGWNWWGIPHSLPYNNDPPSYAGYGNNRRMMGRMRGSPLAAPTLLPGGTINSQNSQAPAGYNNSVMPVLRDNGTTNRRTNGSSPQNRVNGGQNTGTNGAPVVETKKSTSGTNNSRGNTRRTESRSNYIPTENYRPPVSPVPRNTYTPSGTTGGQAPSGSSGNSGSSRSGNSGGARGGGRGRN